MSAKRLAVLVFLVLNSLELFRTAKQDEALNITQLDDVLTVLKNGYFASTNWFDLGLALGLTHLTLKAIEVNHVKDVSRCLGECLVKWLERADDVDKRGGPTWTALANALQKIDKKPAADYIRKSTLPSLPPERHTVKPQSVVVNSYTPTHNPSITASVKMAASPPSQTKAFVQLNLVSRHIPRHVVLPRVHYILEPLLTESTRPDDLLSIYESLHRRYDNPKALHLIMWSLRQTSNERAANIHLKELLDDNPLADDWMPEDPRVLMRLLMARIDMNEHFTHKSSTYERYISSVTAAYPMLGHSDNFPYSNYSQRMDIYRAMEEKKIISPSDIDAVTNLLGMLQLTSLNEQIEGDYKLLLKDTAQHKQLRKYFTIVASKIQCNRILPRIYYLLERLLTEVARSDDLFSMYESLQKRDLKGVDPLWYIMWALKCTQNERLADEYLQSLSTEPYPQDWHPSNASLILRMIIVELDMSETFRDQGNFEMFVRLISQYDQFIGSPANYPHDQFDLRMVLYRHLEERTLITTSNIDPLIAVLDDLGHKGLSERVKELFQLLLRDLSFESIVKKRFETISSKLDCPRILPRIYYLLESLVKEDAKSDNLLSMYLSLRKRDLQGIDPLWYIAWALNHTFNEQMVVIYLHSLLVEPLPDKWIPDDPFMAMRSVIVRMDLSKEFRDETMYLNFVRCISLYDEYIGIHDSFPHAQYTRRMDFYRRLEEVSLITPYNIMKILDGLRHIAAFDLQKKVDKEFRALVFTHRTVTPTSYYSVRQRAHFDKESPYYQDHRLDQPYSASGASLPSSSLSHPPSKRDTREPPSYKSVVSTKYQYYPPTTPDPITTGRPFLTERPSLEERIWINGEAGEDVVKLCIKKLQDSYVFPDDKGFMYRVAHVMSRFGNPPFTLGTDGGIWQVSLYGFDDTLNTRAHVRLTTKYEKISLHFNIDWSTVERRHLEIPMYSAVAARLYLSNFAESIPPMYDVERQADYWWKIYMKNHESMAGLKRADFLETVRTLAK